MIGGWVRDRFCLRVRPSGIKDSFMVLEKRDAKD